MNQAEIEKLPYRECVGMMLINKNKQVFVGKRLDTRADAWQMPQGGVDEGEDLREAVKRELGEETSVKSVKFITETQGWLNYNLPDFLVPNFWGGKYRGQTQKWFLLEFTGDDSEININTAEPEFGEWKWADIDILPNIIVPFKRELYKKVIEEFSEYLK